MYSKMNGLGNLHFFAVFDRKRGRVMCDMYLILKKVEIDCFNVESNSVQKKNSSKSERFFKNNSYMIIKVTM